MEKKNMFSLLRKGMFMMLALLAAGVMVSCSSDDDDEEDAPSIFEKPKYEADAAKFMVTSASSEYKSVELTEAGNFIIRLNTSGNYAPKAVSPMARMLKKNMLVSPGSELKSEVAETRAGTVVWSDIIYGKYTKTGDNEYTLDGYGTLTVTQEGGSAYSLRIEKNNGETFDLEANKSGTPEAGSMTDNICRTWDIKSFRYYIRMNGKTYFDETSPTMEGLYNKIKEWMQANDPDYSDEDYEDMLIDVPQQIVFSKSGTYMVLYTNNMLDVATWRWGNQDMGILEYSWNPDVFDDDFMSGSVKIEFKNNQLLITEGESESEDGFTLEAAFVYTLEEAAV